jgi:hypothetical protein
MRDRFLALWRTAAQAIFALLLAWLIGHGIHIPPSVEGPAELVVIGLGAGVWAYGTHWLQSRTGGDWRARFLRGLGRVLVLGAGALPTYPPATPTVPPAHAAG